MRIVNQSRRNYKAGHSYWWDQIETPEGMRYIPRIGVNAADGNTEQNPDYVELSMNPVAAPTEAWAAIDRAFIVLGLGDSPAIATLAR